MAQDCDEVIMLINFFIEKPQNSETQPAAPSTNKGKQQYVKVNNKTATGGWW